MLVLELSKYMLLPVYFLLKDLPKRAFICYELLIAKPIIYLYYFLSKPVVFISYRAIICLLLLILSISGEAE